MYDTNKTMEMIGNCSADVIADESTKTDIINVIKAHKGLYATDMSEIISLAIDLYMLGFIDGSSKQNLNQSKIIS